MDPTIEKVLSLHNSHVSGADAIWLRSDTEPLLTYELSYGWLLNVPGRRDMPAWDTDFRKAGVSETILGVLLFAEQYDCRWVRLDADGPTSDGLPTFHW